MLFLATFFVYNYVKTYLILSLLLCLNTQTTVACFQCAVAAALELATLPHYLKFLIQFLLSLPGVRSKETYIIILLAIHSELKIVLSAYLEK